MRGPGILLCQVQPLSRLGTTCTAATLERAGLMALAPDYGPDKITKHRTLCIRGERYVWIEENDPRQENLSWWQMTPGTPRLSPAPNWLIRWPHGTEITALLAGVDGHSVDHHWVNSATIVFWP